MSRTNEAHQHDSSGVAIAVIIAGVGLLTMGDIIAKIVM